MKLGLRRRESEVPQRTTIEIALLFSGIWWLDGKRGAGLLIGKEERQKYRLVASDVCIKVKGNFCEVVSPEFFLRDSNHQCCLHCLLCLRWRFAPILLECFVLIFLNQFHLCQLMFQNLLFAFKFQQNIKSQKQRWSSESLIGGNLRTSW